MLLELRFEVPGDQVQEAGALIYRLYEADDRYFLPDVVLRSAPGAQRVEVQEVSVTSVTPAAGSYGRLGAALRERWNAVAKDGGGWVVGRRELAMGTDLPAWLADPIFGGASGQPAELVVTWHYVYTDASGVAAANDVRVRLHFMPRGAQPEPRATGPSDDDYARMHHLPGPLRPRGEHPYNSFAAVDFGTSSSAVAVHDARRNVPRSIDRGQAERLRHDLARLLNGGAPPLLAQQWRDQLKILVADVARRLPAKYAIEDVSSLTAELDGVAAASRAFETADPVLDTVCLALQHRVAECGPELARWLAPLVLGVMNHAFTTPDLDDQKIREVVFDPDTNSKEILSAFKIIERNPLKIELDADTGADAISRGLKAEMFEGAALPDATGSRGRPATTDDLVAHVYYHLAIMTEGFLRADKDAPLQPLVHLVVTYPTTTLPANRQRLADLLRYCLGLDEVVVDFDEGVAAGLFFLMRDFGSQRVEFGAESLQARARLVGSDPPTWQQNMLIIDIGAGTTDIALIGLTLQDITRDGDDQLVRGRHHLIKPEVLNSTGHPQLGGNYLTLRVFYWLKAAILDALVTGPGAAETRQVLAGRIANSLGPDAAGNLAAMVADGGADEPAPPEVAEVLRANLPTHSQNEQESPSAAFELLWSLAEKAKIAFSRREEDEEKEYAIRHSDLQPVLRTIDARKIPGLPELFPLLPAKDLLLESSQFETLVRPVLRKAAELAAWLVRTTFDGLREARLDRVMLSGKTSKMPLLSRVVTEVLSGQGEAGKRLPWNPATLEVESERAKQAAALGACWAQVFRERDAGGDESELNRGRSLVTFDVENLFRSLPCGFSLKLVAAQGKPLLRAGTRMVEDSTGTLVARADWERLIPTFEVHRPNGQTETIQWGVFRYYTHRDPDGFRPSPAVWGPGAGATRGSRIKAQLEVDQALNPYLYLCHGNPHYYVGVPRDLTIELRSEFDNDCWDPGQRRLRRLPAAIWVRAADEDGSRDEDAPLFPSWQPTGGDQTASYFPVFFHTEEGVPSVAMPGRISAPLPAPSQDGYYEFSLHWADGKKKVLESLKVSGPRGPAARYVATLDVQGTLRVHRGDPPYWAAKSFRDIEHFPGSVRRVEMDPGIPELKPSWKPFEGKH